MNGEPAKPWMLLVMSLIIVPLLGWNLLTTQKLATQFADLNSKVNNNTAQIANGILPDADKRITRLEALMEYWGFTNVSRRDERSNNQ
jgi:hypothetical protein